VASGYRSPCKDCNNAYYAKRRVEQYEKVREYEKKFHTERRLRYQYGMTEQDLVNMKVQQNNLCAICDKEVPLVIDHCHAQGHVRGLLCNPCNMGLGLFKDNPKLLEAASNYINKRYK
jgi:hypothetical protein